MFIKEANIYGFGKWVDQTIAFNDSGFVCIYGENESGKSTLQKFMMFMLFGLYPKERTFYRPKTSSKMGGRLIIKDDKIGEFTIERMDHVKNGAATIYLPNGEIEEDNWLRDYLHGMTLKTYESIYSFSALDLVGIQDLREGDIGEILLGIGLTGSTQIYEVDKRLDQKLGELFKPFGKKPLLNQQITSLQEITKKMQEYEREEEKYKDLKLQLLEIEKSIEVKQIEVEKIRKELLVLEKRRQILPLLYEYQLVIQQLESYPEIIPFPEEGIKRMEQINSYVIPLQSELTVLQANQQNGKERIQKWEEELQELLPFEEAMTVLEYENKFIQIEAERKELNERIEKLSNQIKFELDRLNVSITEDELKATHFSAYLGQSLTEIKEMDQIINREKKQLDLEKRQLITEQEHVETQLQELAEEVLSQEQKLALEDRLAFYDHTKLQMKLQKDAKQKQSAIFQNQQLRKKQSRLFLFLSFPITIVLVILGRQLHAPLFYYLALVSFGIGFGQWILRRATERETVQMIADFVTPYVKSETLSDEERSKIQEKLKINEENEREQTHLFERLKKLDVKLLQLEEKRLQHEQKQQEHIQTQQIHMESYPFFKDYEIAYWPMLYQDLKEMVHFLKGKTDVEKKLVQLNEQRQAIKEVVQRILSQTKENNQQTDLLHAFTYIKKQAEQHKKIQGQIDYETKLSIEIEEKQRNMMERLHAYEQEKHKLFAKAEVENEDEFYKTAKQLEEREQLFATELRMRKQYAMIFTDEQWKKLQEEMPTKSIIQAKEETLQADLAKLQVELEEKSAQYATAKVNVQQMEKSETHSTLIQRYQIEKSELNEMAKKWATYKIAKETLQETIRTFKNKYLSKILEKTTNYFYKLTNGGYVKIHAPQGDKPFTVEGKDKIRYTVNELSQGTMNQLYVSLRLAISEVMNEEHRFPFIIDDGFVHFDSTRQKRMMNILLEVAKRQQVIVFTCHQHIVRDQKGKGIYLNQVVTV